ncbi:MAG: hypothetical protein LAO20_05750 [Acidobacteriia bacterium]|nr:hypothetical protein [Terriglobia bacterium]
MDDKKQSTALVVTQTGQELTKFENQLLSMIEANGLPTEDILVPISERQIVFENLSAVVAKLEPSRRTDSVYISKFVAAVASGLFDAALNYLWNETVAELRNRVRQYDISYFYDNAVSSEKRKRLHGPDDLEKIDDSELILGAKEIGLISDFGYRHLDFIRYMRNWASAAHPNQNQLSGLEVVTWLQICIREVISLPLSNIAVEIKKLLANIKQTKVSANDAKNIGLFFQNLAQEQANNLAAGFFGIYTREDTLPQTRDNIRLLLPILWDLVDEDTRGQFGIKYGKFVANNEQKEKALAYDFLQIVSGLSYIPQDLRATLIDSALENLRTAHRGFNNFYNEPPFANELQRIVGQTGIPPQVATKYVHTIVEVYLTNGNGIAYNAETVYEALIQGFGSKEAAIAVLSFTDTVIGSKLQFNLPQQKFSRLLQLLEPKISSPALLEFLRDMKAISPGRLTSDRGIKQKLPSVLKLIKQGKP